MKSTTHRNKKRALCIASQTCSLLAFFHIDKTDGELTLFQMSSNILVYTEVLISVKSVHQSVSRVLFRLIRYITWAGGQYEIKCWWQSCSQQRLSAFLGIWAFYRIGRKPLCFQWTRLHISLSTPACPVQPWERTSGGPVRPWSSRGFITCLPPPSRSCCTRGASVMLFSCSGRVWNCLE